MSKEKLFSEIFSRYNEVIHINREEENADIEKFQKTGDYSILDKIYKNRIPTLKSWASKNYYPGLELTIDDFMEELSIVFVKAASKYKRDKGSFNTCLYTYLTNRIKNMKNSTHAKKRRPKDYEGPLSGIVLSLDHEYENDKSGNETTLKDILASKSSVDVDSTYKEMNFNETLGILSNGNPILKSIFVKIGEGNSLSSIIQASKIKTGSFFISENEMNTIAKHGETAVKELIQEIEDIEDEFLVSDFNVQEDSLIEYTIEFEKTEESEMIKDAIKRLRKEKDSIIREIRGH